MTPLDVANKRRGICGVCPAGCWVVVSYDDDNKIASVQADENSPLGMICKLGERSPEIIYSKERLRHPMRRVGPKGTYKFEKISWDEAYQEIADRLNGLKAEYGPESTAIYTGRGSFELSMCDIFQPAGVEVSSASSVLFPFGSPNTLGVGALCYVSFAMIAPHVTAGGMLTNMFSDIENAELIVVWGANPATDTPPVDYHRILQAKGRGAEVIVIDPRRTKTAKETDAWWIPVRPGTDGALALGIINVIIEEELFDEKFVTTHTLGFDDLARYVQHFTPEYVESVTGVPAKDIYKLARKIVDARGASPVMYSGLEYSDSGVQAIRATITLWALAGQLDTPGGRCFTMRDNHFPINRDQLIENPDIKKALGRDRFPVYSSYRGESHAICLPESVLEEKPYKIRSLIVLGGSIITAWPQPAIWKKTLGTLDFLVTIDRQLTADSAYADIVLPATTYYEIDSYMTYGPIFRLREKMIEPVGEARNDFTILAQLAEKLGYGDLYPQTEEATIRHALKGSGYSLEEVRAAGGEVTRPQVMMQYKKWEKGLLRADGKPGFSTPTGKFEIHSTILEEHGYDPLPVYTEPSEGPLSTPATFERFPLIFNSGSRVTTDFRSQFHGVESLNKERPKPTVIINSKDAKERNIKNGDKVIVTTPRGSVNFWAVVTSDIVRGSIDANMGGGGPVGPEEWQESNVNELTDLKNYDPVSGFPVYKALLCEVTRVAVGSYQDQKLDAGEESGVEAINEAQASITPSRIVYLDHNATTRLDEAVRAAMAPYLDTEYGNPSSVHSAGVSTRFAINTARRQVAVAINCSARRIVFTGGGSEANNLAIKGTAFELSAIGKHIVTTAIEHPSVINTCRWLEGEGFTVTYVQPDSEGQISPAAIEAAIISETILVSVMLANNETGAILPIAEVGKICRSRKVRFHTDAVQGFGKIAINVDQLGVDLLTLSAHKFNGPKGVGALYIRKGIEVSPLIHGGGQEGGVRAGTENVAAIVGFGKAVEIGANRLVDMARVKELRDKMEREIREILPDAKLNGPTDARLPNTLNMTLPGFRGESVALALDQRGVRLSSGSACRSGSPEPSHALLAMGLTVEDAHCAIRISLGNDNSEDEIDFAIGALNELIVNPVNQVRFTPCR